ncbi:MAG: plasma-membrane proton-efflux P-type ATPase [Candidatus ainarchaeum sp.]|nr:plasma-membrane proton-efflux P-type ATPase [Candidatus ainarchaeum sp.]
MDFKTAGVEEVKTALSFSEQGLTGAQARERLLRDGPNSIPEKRTPLWRKVLAHLIAPISLVLLAAGLLSAWIGNVEDAVVILFLYLLNSAIGIYIERKADGALAELSREIGVTARVRRDGLWSRRPAAELVVGDLVELDGGDVVPADIKIIDGEVEVDQSTLTGESLPVACGAGGLTYAASLVQRGHAQGIVALIGVNTTFGRTAQLAQAQRPMGSLDKSTLKIGQYLVVLAVIGSAVVVTVGVARQYPLSETALLALTLLVASVPAAMPAVLATIMAVGAMRLAKAGVVVRQLSSLEELSGVTVICSDKTGTLTENKLAVGSVWTHDCTEATLVSSAASCMPEGSSDPIDAAISGYAQKSPGLLDGWKRIRYIPADGDRKRATVVLYNEKTQSYKLAIKGAPQKVLELCKADSKARNAALSQMERFAGQGFRSLGIAVKGMTAEQIDGPHMQLKTLDESGATLLGLIALSDQPRQDAAATIKRAGEMGVQVRMVTGDHSAAARNIAARIGMKGTELTSAAIAALKGTAGAMKIRATTIFSEVIPAQKFEIVEALQAGGQVVAVTGDGVNDAPALKRAAVGIAVSGANEVARSAADLVLTRPGLSVIVDGIAEGRAIYKRMYHYVTYRLAETFRVLFLVPFAIIIFGFFPLTPLQLVLLSVLNDIPILAMATDNVNNATYPERWRVKRLLGVSSALGLVGLVSSATLLCLVSFVLGFSIEVIQTFLFLKLSLSGHLMLFHARNKGPVLKGTPPSRALLCAVVGTQLLATCMALLGVFVTPISFWLVLFLWGWTVMFFFITEWVKHYAYALAEQRKW